MEGEHIPKGGTLLNDYLELQKLDKETFDLCEEKCNGHLRIDRQEHLAILRDELKKAISRRGGRFETNPDGIISVFTKAGGEHISDSRGTETEKLLATYLGSLKGLR